MEQDINAARGLYTQLCADETLSSERLVQLRSRPFYQEVQEFSPEQSAYTYEVLAEQRRSLQGELQGRQKDRGLLAEKKDNAVRLQQNLQQQMAEILEKAELPLQKDLVFP